ncbi:MAG: septum formation protein Maf [Candidatus Heimdallarchaeota archaeon]|nr:septum formation protein Maf [Candidatus Heimdallarchaeota archaeon]
MVLTLCLASQSKSRREVLSNAYIRFVTQPSSVDEIYEDESPEDYVLKLAIQKAEDVLTKTDASLLVAADSVAVLDEQIIEKPRDRADAIAILSRLQGRSHQFLTGVAVIDINSRRMLTRVVTTKVSFSSLENELIENYVDRFEPYSFAGGYDNNLSSWFIQDIEGSISNLKGMPMVDLREMIEELGHKWFDLIIPNNH